MNADAGQSKGRNTVYPYYFCDQKACPDHRKSIRKEKVEGEFEVLLQALRPTPSLFYMAKEAMTDLWEDRRSKITEREAAAQAELAWLERKSGQLMEADYQRRKPGPDQRL